MLIDLVYLEVAGGAVLYLAVMILTSIREGAGTRSGGDAWCPTARSHACREIDTGLARGGADG